MSESYLKRDGFQFCQQIQVHEVLLTEKTCTFSPAVDCRGLETSRSHTETREETSERRIGESYSRSCCCSRRCCCCVAVVVVIRKERERHDKRHVRRMSSGSSGSSRNGNQERIENVERGRGLDWDE